MSICMYTLAHPMYTALGPVPAPASWPRLPGSHPLGRRRQGKNCDKQAPQGRGGKGRLLLHLEMTSEAGAEKRLVHMGSGVALSAEGSRSGMLQGCGARHLGSEGSLLTI